MPAQTLEGFVPQMKKKGRLHKAMELYDEALDL
jgi:hypothetical protein